MRIKNKAREGENKGWKEIATDGIERNGEKSSKRGIKNGNKESSNRI